MKKNWLLLAVMSAAAILSGADRVISDFKGFKTSGTVRWEKQAKGILVQGEMQGGEVRIPVSAAQLKEYSYATVERLQQSGKWQFMLADGLDRIELKPENPGAIKLNYRISPKMAKDGKEALFVLKLSPGIDLELGTIVFSGKAAASGKYVQRTAKGPLRVFDTPVGKFTIPATFLDETPVPRRENVKFQIGKNDSGLRSYIIDDLRQLHPELRPSKAEFDRTMKLFAAPGQYEGAAFSLYAVKNAPQTRVSATAAVSENGAKLPVPSIRWLRIWPQRSGFEGYRYRDIADLLEKNIPRDIAAGKALSYYFKVQIPYGTKPGIYKGRILFQSGSFPARALPYSVRVSPLRLEKDFKPVIGVYYGYPHEFKLIRDLGINSVLQGHQNAMRNVLKPMISIAAKEKDVSKRLKMLYNGKSLPQLNFADPAPTGMDNFLKAYHGAGFKTVVVWICLGGFTDVIAKFLDLPLDKEMTIYPAELTPAYRKLFKDCIRAINDRAGRSGVRIYWYQFDELGCHGHTRLFKYATEMFKLVKEVGGYTAVTCTEDDFTAMVAPYLDMRIYAIGEGAERNNLIKVRKSTAKHKAMFYSYTGSVYEQHYSNRYNAGFNMYLCGWEGRYFWNLHSQRGNMFNDFDHQYKDSMMLYENDGEIIPTLELECIRQGIDDFRYLCAVEALAVRAAKSSRQEIRTAGVKVQKELQHLKDTMPLTISRKWDIRNFDRYRWRILTLGEYLQELLDGKGVLPGIRFFGTDAKKKIELTFPMQLKAPLVNGKISVDGELSDPGWQGAFLLPQMQLRDGGKTEVPTFVKMARDSRYLYLGFRCIEPDTSKIVLEQKTRDRFVWRDDCVEIFYDRANDHRNARHIIVNASGAVADFENDNIKWDCSGLKSAAKIGKGEWRCEVAIPLSEFTSPVIGINLMRTRVALLSYAILSPDVHNPRLYPKVCVKNIPVVNTAFSTSPLLGRNGGRIFSPVSGHAVLTVNGKTLPAMKFPAGKNFDFPLTLDREGVNNYALSVKLPSVPELKWSFRETLPGALVLKKVPDYVFADEEPLKFCGRVNMNLAGTDGTRLKVTVKNEAGTELFTSNHPVTGKEFTYFLPVKHLTPDSRCTVEFLLFVKGAPAGKKQAAFTVMKAR